MDFLNELSKRNGPVDIDKVIEAIRVKFQPHRGDEKAEIIVKKTTEFLLIQIAEGTIRGFDVISEKLLNHYYPLGYIAGFSVSFIISSGMDEKETQSRALRRIFDNVFSDLASDFFNKTFDPLNADNPVFQEATECGWKEAEAKLFQGKEPTGLKSFLLEV